MEKKEMLQRITEVHNKLAQVYVCNDNAILVGDALLMLRDIHSALQADLDKEEPARGPEKTK